MGQENSIFTAVASTHTAPDVTANSGIAACKAAEIAWKFSVSAPKRLLALLWGGVCAALRAWTVLSTLFRSAGTLLSVVLMNAKQSVQPPPINVLSSCASQCA